MAGLTPRIEHRLIMKINNKDPRKRFFSGADVNLLAADSPKSKHEYEDGGLAFSTRYGNFFIICDGVSGGKSKLTPLYVQNLLANLQKINN